MTECAAISSCVRKLNSNYYIYHSYLGVNGHEPSTKRHPQDFANFLPTPLSALSLTLHPDVWRPQPLGKIYNASLIFCGVLDIKFHTSWMDEKFMKLKIINYSIYLYFLES